MKIQTGQGIIPLITLIGIFSISALNALPGLAVSPILGDLNKIFSVCHGFGNPDAFLVTFTSYYPFYFVIG